MNFIEANGTALYYSGSSFPKPSEARLSGIQYSRARVTGFPARRCAAPGNDDGGV
jgi:hypothetical protein